MKNIPFSGVIALIAVAAIVGITFQPVASFGANTPDATVGTELDSPIVILGYSIEPVPVDSPTVAVSPTTPVGTDLDPTTVVGPATPPVPVDSPTVAVSPTTPVGTDLDPTTVVGPATSAVPVSDGPVIIVGPATLAVPTEDGGSSPTPPTPPTPPGNTGGGGGGGGSGSGSITTPLNQPQGQVLGAATACSPYLTAYLKRGVRNPEAVKMLQTFLKEKEGADLPITGNFGALTFAAVKAFQVKHAGEVLTPWGLGANQATGYVFKTTMRKINNAQCPTLNLPIPVVQ